MKIDIKDPPRVFEVGNSPGVRIRISDCARIELAPDEQVTFVTERGAEYDVARKDWGFYATPSLNGRLASFGLRGVLVRNAAGRYYVMLVERGREDAFDAYLRQEANEVVVWLDSDAALAELAARLKGR
jgi:hypothetical protein